MFRGKRTALKLLVLTFLLSTPALAKVDATTLVNEGVNAYQQSQWDLAHEKFSQLLDRESWEFVAFYNLGNVAARQKRWGEALGYYRKALALKPQDRDTWFNYNFALNALPAKPFGAKQSNYELLRGEILNRFSFAQSLVVLFFSSFLMLWNLWKYLSAYKMNSDEDKGHGAPPVLLIVWGALFVLSLSASSLKLIDTYIERATIVVSKVDLKSGPGDNNASMLELTEGLEVHVQSSVNDWKQVTHPNGLTGWVPLKSLMITSGGGPW